MKPKPKSILALLTGIICISLAACNSSVQNTSNAETNSSSQNNNPTTNDKNVLNLYSARHYDSDKELFDKFTQDTGIKINLIEGKDDELIERIKTEGNNSPADILITVDVGRLWRAQQDGVFQKVSDKELEAAIPKYLRSSEGYWFGISKRARVIVYNTQKVNPAELSSYEELTDAKWKKRICSRSSSNIYNQSLTAFMLEKDGEAKTKQWIQGLVANFARPPEGNDIDQIKSVAAGECDVAIVNHYYLARLKKSSDAKDTEITKNVAVFFPNQKTTGTHINISGVGMTVNAPNKENALKFMEYLVKPEAQEIFANNNHEYPIITSLKPNSIVADFGTFKESDLNVSASGENNDAAVKLMDEAGWK
jgi:iron(III) transport system substrate-binding protein